MTYYGVPYMGSKNALAERIVAALPPAEHFYDLFAGGCAVAHAALLSGKWRYVHVNDVNGVPSFFRDAIDGKYSGEFRWVSREEFFEKKDTDMLVRTCWSFGNNGIDYIYGRDIEPYKRAAHFAICFNDWRGVASLCPEVIDSCEAALSGVKDVMERRLRFCRAVRECVLRHKSLPGKNAFYGQYAVKTKGIENMRALERVVNLERLQRFQSISGLAATDRLIVTKGDWRDVVIEDDAVIYNDIPYRDSSKPGKNYGLVSFDWGAFYDWAEGQSRRTPLFISEYSMPDDRFECVAEWKHRSTISATANNAVAERLFRVRGSDSELVRGEVGFSF